MKKLIVAVLIVLMILSLTACGAGSFYDSGSNSAGGASYNTAAEMPATAPSVEYEESLAADANSTSSEAGNGTSVTSGRKITFSASVSLNTKQFDADYLKILELIDETGGFIASENMYDNSAQYGKLVGRNTWISARVPADDYNSFLDAVSEIGEVTQRNKWSEDLTSEYFDTEARIELLEIRKDRLMAYLLEAESAEDIVAFERELSDVLYDLDSFQGNKRRLDRLVDYATVEINLTEVITPETIGKDGEPLGARASDAFSLSMTGVGKFLENAAIFFAAAAPVIILIVVILVIVLVIIRVTRPLREKLRPKREARRERRQERRQSRYQQNAPYWQQPGYQPPPQTPPGYQTPPAQDAAPKEPAPTEDK